MIWEVFIVIAIIVLSVIFGIVCVYEKPKPPQYKPSAYAVHMIYNCSNIIVDITDKMGIVRNGIVVGSIGDDVIIGFGNDVAPIKDIDGSTKIDKRWYKSYWVVNKDIMYEAYKHRFLHIVKINVNWGFRNLDDRGQLS